MYNELTLRQPVQPAPVDRTKPESVGLVYLGLPVAGMVWDATLTSVGDPAAMSSGGPLSTNIDIGGRSVHLTDGGTQIPGVGIPTDGDLTIEVLVSLTSAPPLAAIFGFSTITSGNYPSAAPNGNTRGMLVFGGGSNQNIYFWGNSADVASGVDWRIDGMPQHVFITVVGSTATFYRDGLLIGSGTVGPSALATAGSTIVYGANHVAGAFRATGGIYKAAIYNYALGPGMIQTITNNPYIQLYDDFDDEMYPLVSSTGLAYIGAGGGGGFGGGIGMTHVGSAG